MYATANRVVHRSAQIRSDQISETQFREHELDKGRYVRTWTALMAGGTTAGVLSQRCCRRKQVKLPRAEAPEYVVRAILIYARSQVGCSRVRARNEYRLLAFSGATQRARC
jgi:hypothetical protein